MSVQTLSVGQINTFDCLCNVTGAITGSTTIIFRRYNHIIDLSFPAFAPAVGVPGPTIIYTPTVTVPDQYKPVAGVARFITVANNSVPDLGQMSFPNTFAQFTVTLHAGGNFTGNAGVVDNTISWAASN